MAAEFEAAADLATGGLLARSVEPRAGDAHGHADVPDLCLNCGTRLIGEHCHACGQAGHVHKTMGAIGHDIAHGVFHFEGRAWRTLPMLAFHPGALTRRYIDGERARFVSPIAMFLFSVFLLFAVVPNLPGWKISDEFLKSGVTGGVAEARSKLTEERKKAEDALKDAAVSLREERADAAPNANRIARLERRLATAEAAQRDLAAAEKALPLPSTMDVEGAPAASGSNWVDAKWRHAKENPKLLLYKVKTGAYKYSWALIPLSLPFLWLLFPFSRRFGFYDHAVFATYSLTFMSLLAVMLATLGAIGVPWQALMFAGMIVPLAHIYKQLKGTYELTRTGAAVRLVLLSSAIFWIIMPLFAGVLLYLGVAD